MRRLPVLLLLVGACTGSAESGAGSEGAGEEAVEATREVLAYHTCESANPGELIGLPRAVPADLDPAAGALHALLAGVTEEERTEGCASFFTSATADALISATRSATGDTLLVDFRDFSSAIPDVQGARSSLPPGVMAELTWTIFKQFREIEAVRFAFDGDEAAFWSWIASEPTRPEAFTRQMWEEI